MRLLQLTKKFPLPPKDGETIAITTMARAYARTGWTVDLLAMNTRKHHVDVDSVPHPDYYERIDVVEVDNRVRIAGALRNLVAGSPFHIDRHDTAGFRAALERTLASRDYDAVQLETVFLTPYVSAIRAGSSATVILRSHNVEHQIWRRIAANTRNPLKRAYLQLQAERLARYELAHLHDYDVLVPISQGDDDQFAGFGHDGLRVVAPVGVIDPPEPPVSGAADGAACGFIGSLDWMPNTEGLKWLLERVWPRVIADAPHATLHIGGRNAPDWLRQWRQPGVTVHGEVPDAVEFTCRHPIMLVPLLSGGGMRVKILESMALARTVISTPIGIEGIPARHGHEALIASTPEAFARAILDAIATPADTAAMGARARDFVVEAFDGDRIARRVTEAAITARQRSRG